MIDPIAEHAAADILKLLGLKGRLDFSTESAVAEIVQEAMDDHYNQLMQDAEGS